MMLYIPEQLLTLFKRHPLQFGTGGSILAVTVSMIEATTPFFRWLTLVLGALVALVTLLLKMKELGVFSFMAKVWKWVKVKCNQIVKDEQGD